MFSDFIEHNFLNITHYEIATLYRDCYSIGRGFISNDIFHAVANEQHFFAKYIK